LEAQSDSRASDLIIRPLEESDFQELVALYESVAQERRWIGTEPGFDKDQYIAHWRRQLDGIWGAAFVAIRNDCIVGYAGTKPHEEYGHLVAMMVREGHRREGIGGKLLDAALNWARERALPSISLLVFAHNERAIALYRARGFQQREYYEEDVTRQSGEVWDTILMTKTLIPT
jgi:ribosomal protein S18 acetylase RimI-like enzyme